MPLPRTAVALRGESVQRVTFVQGGFARVGGIESFAADLLSVLDSRRIRTELICWGAGSRAENPLLANLSMSGVKVSRISWRWGCRWGWPDRVMAARHWKSFADAELLVFGKLLHDGVHRRILSLHKRSILITPYRPAEMWKDSCPDEEVLNSFESIIVQAHSFEDDLRRLGYKGRVIALPYLPPEARETCTWPANLPLQIGFLGRLVPDKNVKYLIQSFSRLREMGMEAELHLFGDGPERSKLECLTDRIGLGAYIRFHGNLDRGRIPEAIDSCHLFAFSSRTEGQCLAALEILARGRPLVGTPVGVFPEILTGRLGSVAPLEAPGAFAAAIYALARPILRGEVVPGDIRRAYLGRFQRQNVIEEYMQVFSGCYPAQRKAQAV